MGKKLGELTIVLDRIGAAYGEDDNDLLRQDLVSLRCSIQRIARALEVANKEDLSDPQICCIWCAGRKEEDDDECVRCGGNI